MAASTSHDQFSAKEKEEIQKLKEFIEHTLNWKKWEDEHSSENRVLEDAQKVFEELINDKHHLLRLLIARKHNLDDCYKLFVEQLNFRAKWKPKETTPDDIPHAIKSKAWRLCGYSKEGCIVSNYKLKYWKPSDYGPPPSPEKSSSTLYSYMPSVSSLSSFYSSSSNKDTNTNENTDNTENVEDITLETSSSSSKRDDAIDEYVRYVSYMCELMIGKMKEHPTPQKFVVLFDLEGFEKSMVLSKRARGMIGKLIYVAQAQYPERLFKVYLINAPWGFSTAWKLIKPVLDEKTASKVQFVSGTGDALAKSMSDHIDENVLSTVYGGTHPEYAAPSLELCKEIEKEISSTE